MVVEISDLRSDSKDLRPQIDTEMLIDKARHLENSASYAVLRSFNYCRIGN